MQLPEGNMMIVHGQMSGSRMRMSLIGAAVVATALAGSSITSAAQNIKIGLINSYSGFLAQSGDEMQKGIDLYLKEHE